MSQETSAISGQQESPTLLDAITSLVNFCDYIDRRGGLGIDVHQGLRPLITAVKKRLFPTTNEATTPPNDPRIVRIYSQGETAGYTAPCGHPISRTIMTAPDDYICLDCASQPVAAPAEDARADARKWLMAWIEQKGLRTTKAEIVGLRIDRVIEALAAYRGKP